MYTIGSAKPFVKWAGGKSQLIEQYIKLFPIELSRGKIKRYVEPFIGGGALFFFIAQNYPSIEEFYINDYNTDLTFTYQVIKDSADDLIGELKAIEKKYYDTINEKKQNFFYEIRRDFNIAGKTIRHSVSDPAWIIRATQLIFLNRTCFNGLFRVNSKGEFNVPFGKYTNPRICDEDNLKAVSKVLNNNVTILNGDFESVEKYVNDDTLVYFDPPYRPLNITSSFTSYSKMDFNDDQQIRLARFYKRLHQKSGVKLMLSNSDSLYEGGISFFRRKELFGEDDLYINNISAARMINSNSNGRGLINELLILNYNNENVEDNSMKELDKIYSSIGCKSQQEVFKYLLSTLKDSIKGWNYFVNWDKALGNTKEVEIDLNILNYLVGKENVVDEFKLLLKRYPGIYRLIPILIACRDCDFNIMNPKDSKIFNYEYFEFKKKSRLSDDEINKAAEFAENTGILNLFKNKTIKNIVDYVFGVEVGLDSNGRKNRSGTSMENLIERFIKMMCKKHNYEYLVQATSSRIMEKWGIHVTVDKSERRFDFSVYNGASLYLIETNFYSGGGSKLKATAGEYKALYDFITNDNHKFIWITDGEGWHTAERPLEETFTHIDYILNLDMIEKGILEGIINMNK